MTQPDKEKQVKETVFLSDPPYVDADGNGVFPQGMEYILKAKHDAEIAEREARSVKVKPLSWGKAERRDMEKQADCPFGRYYISVCADGVWLWYRPATHGASEGSGVSEQEVMVAAQADYERRILSALEVSDGA